MNTNEKVEKEKLALMLMQEYANLKKKLNDFGICRTERDPTGDYAEWLIASKLNLQQAENPVQSGYDLINLDTGVTYQVKARRIYKEHGYKVSIKKYNEYRFDYLILVLFKEDFTILKAYEFTYDSIPLFFKKKDKDMEIMIKLSNYSEKLDCVKDRKILML